MGEFIYIKDKKINVGDSGEVSDGFHTFNELYEHRKLLSAIAFKYAKEKGWHVWRSKRHHGEENEIFGGGWFIVGVTRPDGKQYSYHYEIKDWALFDFAEVLPESPPYDGHKPADIDRLLDLLK